jgi:hypothetical protein
MAFQLDTRIPLSAEAPQFANPLSLATAAQQFQMQREQHGAMQEQRGLLADQRRLAIEKAQRDEAESGALRKLFSGEQAPTNDQIFAVVGPQRGSEIVKGLNALRTQEVKDYGELQTVVGRSLGGLSALPESMRPGAYQAMREQFVQRGWLNADQVPAEYSPEYVKQAQMWALTPKEQLEINKPQTHTVGGNLVQVGADGKATTVYEAPEKPAEAGSLADYMDSFAQSLGLKSGRQLNPKQKLQAKAQHEAAGRAPTVDNEPLQAVMGDDGKPVLVRRRDAIGKTPASNREQGRQVTSADAGTLAELTTSLDDLAVVRRALTGEPGKPVVKTGAGPKLGASVPDWVTSITGWGVEEKKTQATIDRVKQVIGKAFEGGVLRKEDELKYEKILPKISDTPEVVISKLNELDRAIKLRRSRQIDSLADAGYDVSRFVAREQGGAAGAGGPTVQLGPDAASRGGSSSSPGAGGMVKMQPPGGGPAQDVPAAMVGHYESLGAKRVK